MTRPMERTPVEVPASHRARVLELYERGLCLQAYAVAREVGPIPRWTGTDARILAGRLAGNLGSPRLADALFARAHRADPRSGLAAVYHGRGLLQRRGPLAAWETLGRLGDLAGEEARVRADACALRAQCVAVLRDFEAAHRWMAEAQALAPEDPWIDVARFSVLEREDRFEEALEAARRSLDRRPFYRPAVLAAAHGLLSLGRAAEAETLLDEASRRLESAAVLASLALLHREVDRPAACLAALDRFAEHAPLLDRAGARWLAAQRCAASLAAGDVEAARTHALAADDDFHRAIASRLDGAAAARHRVRLTVPFSQQRHRTCVPATLSMLAGFFDRPVDGLQLAQAICYDGTPPPNDRQWAEAHGWAVREFSLSWEAARTLIDRRVPFLATTAEPGMAHAFAVAGYDEAARLLLIRDPGAWPTLTVDADRFLDDHRYVGPRCLAVVPAERSALLDGIDLPDARAHDHLYRMQCALREHDRDAARLAVEDLAREVPDHRLLLRARADLAAYDRDTPALLAAVERLLACYPGEKNLLLCKAGLLRDLSRRADRLALIEETATAPISHPRFLIEWAEELSRDPRQHEQATRLLRRAMRALPTYGPALHVLAGIHWVAGRFTEGAEIYRFAACVDDMNEQFVQDYFLAARHLGQTDRAIAFLEERLARLGAQSPLPASTLFWAYSQLDRMEDAFRVLDRAHAARPDDGDLLLWEADMRLRHGDAARGAAQLEEARGQCREGAWLRAAAIQDESRGDLRAALDRWRRVLHLEPLALDGHAAVAGITASTDGLEAAIRGLAEAASRFPHGYGLQRLWLEWLTRHDLEAALPALGRFIEQHPVDAWARRALALLLASSGRHAEALDAARVGRDLAPTDPDSLGVLGRVLALAGRATEADAAYREALARSAEYVPAMARLMESAATPAERDAVLRTIEEELLRQPIAGDGIVALREISLGRVENERLLASVERLLAAREDLWPAWSATTLQLLEAGRPADAAARAQEATRRFPLVSRLWLDLATVERVRGDPRAEKAALEKALEVAPGDARVLRRVAAVEEQAGRLDRARSLLGRSLALAPLDGSGHTQLARLLWRMDRREDALAQIERALALDPGLVDARGDLCRWTDDLGRRDRPEAVAREIATRRAGDANAWLLLAAVRQEPEGSLEAVERALALEPRNVVAHDLKATLLAEARRYEEAAAACRPAAFGEHPPVELRGRAAWVEAARGDTAGAIARMRALLAEDPTYYWGASQLAAWCRFTRDVPAALDAARSLARLAPLDPHALVSLAQAKEAAGDAAGARADLERALALYPGHFEAGIRLVDLLTRQGDTRGARAAIGGLARHATHPEVVALRSRIAARERKGPEALDGLAALCRLPGATPEVLGPTVHALRTGGWEAGAESVIREAMEASGAHPWLGRTWVGLAWGQGGAGAVAGPIGRHPFEGPWIEAAADYVECLGRQGPGWRLWWLVFRRGAELRAQAATWGSVGYAYVTRGAHRRALRWLADADGRADVKPWMLLNLAVARRVLGMEKESLAASRRALGLPPDHTTPCHDLWVASGEARDGLLDAAARRLARAEGISLEPFYRCLRDLVALLVDASRPASAGGDVKTAFSTARGRLSRAAARAAVPRQPLLRPIYREVARRIARARGGLVGRIWGFLRVFFS